MCERHLVLYYRNRKLAAILCEIKSLICVRLRLRVQACGFCPEMCAAHTRTHSTERRRAGGGCWNGVNAIYWLYGWNKSLVVRVAAGPAPKYRSSRGPSMFMSDKYGRAGCGGARAGGGGFWCKSRSAPHRWCVWLNGHSSEARRGHRNNHQEAPAFDSAGKCA